METVQVFPFVRILCLALLAAAWPGAVSASIPEVVIDAGATPREHFGAERLRAALRETGVNLPSPGRLLVGVAGSPVFEGLAANAGVSAPDAEAFHLSRHGDDWLVVGSDPSGVLYGCFELSARILREKRMPEALDVVDKPAFPVRGTNLFWMKREHYDWPVTPEEFPWFFDRDLMERYLDQLAESRFNALFFWNGHPFPYLLELPRYPEARMLSDEELRRNIEHFRWFTREADRRGIATVLHFYNIHVSPKFAEAHAAEGVKVMNMAATPLLAGYMRHCVSELLKSYPNVGLMLTAGEALKIDSEEYVRDVILAGVRDSGQKPLLFVRQWWINPERYAKVIAPSYDDIFTIMKHNIEMLVSPHPDARHRKWIEISGRHIINLHENADIKPYRWASPLFVQEMTSRWLAMGAKGFHAYPLQSWQWPTPLDNTNPPLSALDRDRMWIELFGRYGWQPSRDAAAERVYWRSKLAARFGSREAGAAVLDYYTKTGPVLPGLQNLVNIYNMNYHPTALGQEATLDAILQSDRLDTIDDVLARPLDQFTLSRYEQAYGGLAQESAQRPPLSVKEFLRANLDGRPIEGVEPVKLAGLFARLAEEALESLQTARSTVSLEPEEYSRFINDSRCILEFARFYEAKIRAALEKGFYDGNGGEAHHQRMLESLATSVGHYAELVRLAAPAYRQVTDLLPIYDWRKALASFEEELRFYRDQTAVKSPQVVYLGLHGALTDAGEAFHWTLEHDRKKAGWQARSYPVNEESLDTARLAIVYDVTSPAYRKLQPRLREWVRDGGILFLWDPAARAFPDDLLDGLEFWTPAAHRPIGRFGTPPGSQEVQLLDDPHPLLRGLSGQAVRLVPPNTLASGVRSASGSWRELAHAVFVHRGEGQFYADGQTFGPRWTTVMSPVKVPSLLVRTDGSGSIVLAQCGAWRVPLIKTPLEDPAAEAPEFIRVLVRNLVAWAGPK